MSTPAIDRVLARIVIDDNGCWIWQGATRSPGYGHVGVKGPDLKWRMVGTHRITYEYFIGPIPDGHQLDHLCRVRLCANPYHLEAVTSRENTLRSPVAIGGLNAAKTHCKRGHEFTAENTYRRGTARECRICRAASHHKISLQRHPIEIGDNAALETGDDRNTVTV